MDQTLLRQTCVTALPAMKRRLGLSSWHITLHVNSKLPREKDTLTQGQVHPSPLYGRARIMLDPSHIDTRAEALDVLRHELLHLVLEHLEGYNDQAVAAVGSEAARDALEESHEQAVERTVLAMERMLDAAGLTPARLARPFPAKKPAPRRARRRRP